MADETTLDGCIDEMDNDQLMEFYDDWVMECDASEAVFNMLGVACENANSFDDIRPFLEAANLLDEFEDYVYDMLA